MARKAANSARRDPARPPRPVSRSTTRPATRRRPLGGDRYRLEGTYERLRRALVEAPDDGRLDHPLSFWVAPSDRRLPIAFLDRTLRDLLALPLGELMETPGVGRKKILGFFDLLRRAIKSASPSTPFGLRPEPEVGAAPPERRGAGVAFDPGAVSELVWSGWCEAILRAGFGDHALGRVAPSLRPLPTVIWETPLAEYAERSLDEIRGLKTHGRKRVAAILEVFSSLYEAVSTAVLDEGLQLDVGPRFAAPLNRWLLAANADPRTLTLGEAQQHLGRTLVEQVEIDLDDGVARIVAERLGLEGQPPSVKAQADRRNVTRARVYQLLDECARVMAVRWPEGRWLLAPLAASRLTAGAAAKQIDADAVALVGRAQTLFYPAD